MFRAPLALRQSDVGPWQSLPCVAAYPCVGGATRYEPCDACKRSLYQQEWANARGSSKHAHALDGPTAVADNTTYA